MTDDDYALANARMAHDRADGHVLDVHYDHDAGLLRMALSTGQMVSLPVGDMQGLSDAHERDIADVRISPSGLGIRFPRLDADFSVQALRDGVYGSPKWMKRLRERRDHGAIS